MLVGYLTTANLFLKYYFCCIYLVIIQNRSSVLQFILLIIQRLPTLESQFYTNSIKLLVGCILFSFCIFMGCEEDKDSGLPKARSDMRVSQLFKELFDNLLKRGLDKNLNAKSPSAIYSKPNDRVDNNQNGISTAILNGFG